VPLRLGRAQWFKKATTTRIFSVRKVNLSVPFNAIEKQMVPMLRGKAKPKFEPPKSWLKFVQNSPEYSGAL
jgi:hypothetical protein